MPGRPGVLVVKAHPTQDCFALNEFIFWEHNGKRKVHSLFFLRDKKIKLNVDIEGAVSWMFEQQK
jgi:hypothetical protein